MKQAERRLADSLAGPAISLLDSTPADLWSRLELLLASSTQRAAEVLSEGLSGYLSGAEPGAADRLNAALAAAGRAKLEGHVREAANTALSRMKDKCAPVAPACCGT